ncbi:unnamed protein product, partial [Rotaria sp. Silwood2]
MQSTNNCDIIQPDVYSLHYNKDLWDPEDAKEFIPERHPMAFMPFGQGSRNCIGMRFGLMKIKLCWAQFLSPYKISIGDKTKNNFIIREILVIQPDAVYIKHEKS